MRLYHQHRETFQFDHARETSYSQKTKRRRNRGLPPVVGGGDRARRPQSYRLSWGATAAQALISRDFRVTHQRAEMIKSPLAPLITATVHPSSILRSRAEESRHAEMRQFVDDLKRIARHLPSSALKLK